MDGMEERVLVERRVIQVELGSGAQSSGEGGGGTRMGPNLRCSVMNLDVGFFLPGSDFPPGVQATYQTRPFLTQHVFPPITQPT